MSGVYGYSCGSGHPFYVRLSEVLEAEDFDVFIEKLCAVYTDGIGRPGLTPGLCFR